MSRIQLPKIGTIVGTNKDGSYRQGPIPGLGGPFETAAEFLRLGLLILSSACSKINLKWPPAHLPMNYRLPHRHLER